MDWSTPLPSPLDSSDAAPGHPRFFAEVLGQPLGAPELSADSNLRDFSLCGIPQELLANCQALADFYTTWDFWVLERLETVFGVRLSSTDIPLRALFGRLPASGNDA